MLNSYLQEMQFLMQLAAQFAKDYPEHAASLNLAAHEQDPHVERLFSGMAFLTAKLTQQIAAMPAHIDSLLLRLMMPHCYKVVPALTLLQFKTDLPFKTIITRHSTVRINNFNLLTTQDIALSGWQINTLLVKNATTFTLELQSKWELMSAHEARQLIIYLHPSKGEECNLWYLLLHAKVLAIHNGKSYKVNITTDSNSFAPTLPQELTADLTFVNLLEYLVYREKYFFVALEIEGLGDIKQKDILSLEFMVQAPLPILQDNCFLLNVVPAINLSLINGEPIIIKEAKSRYLLPIDVNADNVLYAIDTVACNDKSIDYSYELIDNCDKYYIKFPQVATGMVITTKLWVSSGRAINEASILGGSAKLLNYPSYLQVNPLIAPTPFLAPPKLLGLDVGYYRLLNVNKLLDLACIKELLTWHSWRNQGLATSIINLITAVKVDKKQAIKNYRLCNMLLVTFTIHNYSFYHLSELYLFARVWHTLLTVYTQEHIIELRFINSLAEVLLQVVV